MSRRQRYANDVVGHLSAVFDAMGRREQEVVAALPPPPLWPTQAESLLASFNVYDRAFTRSWLEPLFGRDSGRVLVLMGDRVVLASKE